MTNLEVLEECAAERLPQLVLEARRLRDSGQRGAAAMFERKADRVRVALHFISERRKAREAALLGVPVNKLSTEKRRIAEVWSPELSPVELERKKRLGEYE